jgi:hypothetical protein
MAYHLYDFVESLRGGTGINHHEEPKHVDPQSVKRVIAAWGHSPDGYGSWAGGFLMELKDGRFAYLTGWCDTTGWGCQDGSDIVFFDERPELAALDKPSEKSEYGEEKPGDWDLEPIDLNKWLDDGAKDADAI